MKKILIASPTFVFLVMVILGLFGHQSAGSQSNLLGFGTMGLIGYSFIAIFAYGLSFAFQGHSHVKFSQMPRGSKLLFEYLIAVLVVTLFTAIYFMAHN
ncbi:LasU family protein [Lacticaseibacillus daqingensis]|uniref:LasU family protein n=1 Tax=Lacticaseibacillus daqingensis TaxID=2486014 RepID=UPI000F7A3D4D|nr:LasU family protein [Lacticaseibacillus daqingensis]